MIYLWLKAVAFTAVNSFNDCFLESSDLKKQRAHSTLMLLKINLRLYQQEYVGVTISSYFILHFTLDFYKNYLNFTKIAVVMEKTRLPIWKHWITWDNLAAFRRFPSSSLWDYKHRLAGSLNLFSHFKGGEYLRNHLFYVTFFCLIHLSNWLTLWYFSFCSFIGHKSQLLLIGIDF